MGGSEASEVTNKENERLLRDLGVLRDENLRLMAENEHLRGLLDPDNDPGLLARLAGDDQ